VVTTAEGERTAAITRAEGEKAATILTAEGLKERQLLEAPGEADAIKAVADAEKYRQLTVAEGEADAIRSVYSAIHDGNPSNDLIAIKYLETLGRVANGQATKIFLPADMSANAGPLAGIGELFRAGEIDAGPEDHGRSIGPPPPPPA
jgi:regulator of protease activity HflC (stomatin/prohibitin superfamily)